MALRMGVTGEGFNSSAPQIVLHRLSVDPVTGEAVATIYSRENLDGPILDEWERRGLDLESAWADVIDADGRVPTWQGERYVRAWAADNEMRNGGYTRRLVEF